MCLFCFRAHTAESVPCMQALMHSPIYVYAFRPLSLLLHAELWEGIYKTICQNWQLFGGMNKETTHILHTKVRSRCIISTNQTGVEIFGLCWMSIGTN